MDKIPVSVLIMTKNEENNIRCCLESVKLADEVVIVDSDSTDKTLDIAREYTDRVIQYCWDGKNPKKRWSVDTPDFKYDWVCMIDADERATPDFMEELRGIVCSADQQSNGYLARYDYWFLGKMIKHGDPVRKVVIFRKSQTDFEGYDISGADCVESLEVGHEHPVVRGKIGYMKTRLLHEDKRALYFYFDRHNRYSSWEAHLIETQRYKQHNLRRFMKKIFLRLPFKPLVYFIYGYFFRLGFLDGYPGFAYNVCKAFYAFQISLKVREMRKSSE